MVTIFRHWPVISLIGGLSKGKLQTVNRTCFHIALEFIQPGEYYTTVLKNGLTCSITYNLFISWINKNTLLWTLRGFVYFTSRKSVSCVPTLPKGTFVYLHYFTRKTEICFMFVVLFQIPEKKDV